MTVNRRLPDWAKKAEKKLGVKAIPWSTGEVHSPCPACGGKDRLIIWEEGNTYCRQCERKASWKQHSGTTNGAKAAKRRQAAWDIAQCVDWLSYHEMALRTPAALQMWREHGMDKAAVLRWGLGYTPVCPTWRSSASLTIPVFGGGRLLDIRHRLSTTTLTSGKYRSHVLHGGLIADLFNREALRVAKCVVVEGAKKAIVFEQAGISCAGTYGASARRDLMAIAKQTRLSVVLAFDPDAEGQAIKAADALLGTGATVWVASFFDKPDDVLLRYGVDVVYEILRQAQRVRG